MGAFWSAYDFSMLRNRIFQKFLKKDPIVVSPLYFISGIKLMEQVKLSKGAKVEVKDFNVYTIYYIIFLIQNISGIKRFITVRYELPKALFHYLVYNNRLLVELVYELS